jgi:hypothetical protein
MKCYCSCIQFWNQMLSMKEHFQFWKIFYSVSICPCFEKLSSYHSLLGCDVLWFDRYVLVIFCSLIFHSMLCHLLEDYDQNIHHHESLISCTCSHDSLCLFSIMVSLYIFHDCEIISLENRVEYLFIAVMSFSSTDKDSLKQ